MSDVADVDERTFDSTVLGANSPVLVDFWAPWCAPCRMVAPIVGELAQEYAGKMGFFKLNTDENPAIAAKYHIHSIPALIIFKEGKPMTQIIGYRPKGELKKRLDQALAGSP